MRGRRIRNSGWEVKKEKKNAENGRRKIWNRGFEGKPDARFGYAGMNER